jgi:DNA polymerase elongation subunit (family B)
MIKEKKLRVLLFDIETTPTTGYVWTLFETNVIKVIEPWHLLCFSYKWLGDKTTQVVALPQFPLYKKNTKNDYEIVKKLHELFEEADIIIAHNGDKFDIRKVNAKMIQHGFNPPSPYKTIDTLKIARRYFKFDSNRLNDLGELLGLGKKVETGGFSLWEGCIAGNIKAWEKMKRYNKQDVVLLERVYIKLRPWMKNHPSLFKSDVSCPKCGSNKIQWRGYHITVNKRHRRFQCQECGGWGKEITGEKIVKLTKNIS